MIARRAAPYIAQMPDEDVRDRAAARIRAIPDFPVEGVLFRDITPLLADAGAFGSALDWLADCAAGADAIMGIESRGFIFGAAVADRLGLPFLPARKGGKLPWGTIRRPYALEYGEATLEIHADALSAGQRAAIVDDLLATGGTAEAAAQLVHDAGGTVASFSFAIELPELGGRERLEPFGPVNALLAY